MLKHGDLNDVASDLEGVDWTSTPIGPVDGWDMRLRTIVGLILRKASPACLFWGPSGAMIFNSAMRGALGTFQAKCLGKPLVAVQESLGEVHAKAFATGDVSDCAAFAAALIPMMWRLLADRPGFALSCLPVPGDDGAPQGVIVERNYAHALSAEMDIDLQDRNAFQLRLSDAIRRLDDPEEIQTIGTRMLGELLRADRASFAEIDAEAGLALERFEYRRDPGKPPHMSDYNLGDAGLALRLLQNGMPVVIRDVRAAGDPAMAGVAAETLNCAVASFRAQLTVPVLRSDKLVSVMTLRFDAPHDWSVDEIAIAQETATRIWETVERARAEARLRMSEARHRALFEAIDEGVCLFERLPLRPDGLRDYRYVAMNSAMQVMFGVPDLTGQSIRDNFPDEIEDWYDDYDMVLDTGKPIRMVRESEPQGMVLEMFVTRVEGVGGKMLLAVMQNVTARVRAEEALRKSEQRMRNVLDGMDEAFGLMDKDLRIITQNKAALMMDGRSLEDIAGRTHWEVYPGTEDSEIGRLYKRALAEGTPVSLEHRYEWPGGGATWLDMRAYPVPEGLAVFWRDITNRKEAEEALRQSELRLRMAQKAAGVATFDWEIGDGAMNWSPEALHMLGLRPGALGGTYEDWIATIHPDDLQRAIEQIEWALEDGELEGEWRVLRADGSVIWVLVRGTVERDAQNRPLRLTGAQVDVTDRVRSEQDTRALISDLSAQINDLRRRLDKGPA